MKTEPRAAYIAGLRQLADWLEANPDIELPSNGGSWNPINFSEWGPKARDKAAAFARAMPGVVRKGGSDGYFTLRAQLAGLHVQFIAHREAVCERVVVGEREVTETIPDPQYDGEIPMIEVTKTVEDIEWHCPPILEPTP